jgi:ABC-type transport system involved in multi-copper enzyme maturation permease subunit
MAPMVANRWSILTAFRVRLGLIAVVALYEIRLHRRSPAFWIIQAFFLYTAVTGVLFVGSLAATTVPTSMTASRAIFLSFFFLPMLFARTFARDRARRFRPMLWSRPVAPAEYALGKALGASLLGMWLACTLLFTGWVTLALVGATIPPPLLWLSLTPFVLVAPVLAVSLALLCVSVLPLPFLGALLSAALLCGLDIFTPQTLLRLNPGALTDFYYGSTLGFGPDLSLMLGEALVFLSTALLILALLMLALQMRERYGTSLKVHWFGSAGMAAVALALLLTSLLHFQASATQYQAPGPAPAPRTGTVDHYHLTLTLDPSKGELTGRATFALTLAQQSTNSFSLLLNPGLTVSRVFFAPAGIALPFHSSPGWTTVDVSKLSLVARQPVILTIVYAGDLELDRDDYAPQPFPGLQVSSSSSFSPSEIRDYSGQGIAFLEGTGDWYPQPWLNSAAIVQGNHQVFEQLSVRLPASFRVFCALGTPHLSPDGQWKELDIQPAGPLPSAFLAALATPEQMVMHASAVYYQGLQPSGAAAADSAWMQQIPLLDAWLGPTSTTWIGVVVPFINQVVVGPGLLLLPDAPTNTGGSGITSAYYTSQMTLARTAAGELASAWWSNAIQVHSPNAGTFSNEPASLQTPGGRVMLPTNESPLLDALAAFSAGEIASRVLGQDFAAQQLATLRGLATSLEPSSNEPGSAPTSAQIAEQNALETRATNLGLTNVNPGADLALVHLQSELGLPAMTRLFQQFIRDHVRAPATLQDFIAAASLALGHDFGPEIRPYLSPD